MLVLTQPDLPQDQTLKWSAEYRALRATQNTIGNTLGLNATSRKQLASATKQVDVVAELAALATVKEPGDGK
jgi:hypothetical protein